MNLVIVESPTKANTIKKFLGQDYSVLSSFGHVRDLPKSELGIDTEKDFEIKYVIPTKARKKVSELKKEAKKADIVYLATDPDREGEAIAWHLSQVLNLKNNKRIVFHEITEKAIKSAFKKPLDLDSNLVDAQQTRRSLDRLVGYKLSPFLWKKVARRLSAGRVQSVAVRLIVERENEIQNFKKQEYFTISVLLEKKNNFPQFEALLKEIKGKTLSKLDIKNKKQAEEIVEKIKKEKYIVKSIEKKELRRMPLPPFTTSSMQQTAAKKFGFTSKMTMRLAQDLYEQGLITYHRTDSLNLSVAALTSAQKFIKSNFGENYSLLRKFKTKGRAQEAHEAIRPTFIEKKEINLDPRHKKLYQLIWSRFIASQMKEAIFDSTGIEIFASSDYIFKANGSILKFDGFLKVYPIKYEEKELPKLKEKDELNLINLEAVQHFTEPPARYTEASLIKELEKNEIGRPSTYAPIISTIQTRNYVVKNKDRRFEPTQIGLVVNDILVEHFPEIVDIKFTAQMEKDLDQIAQGKKDWLKILKDFYYPFEKNLAKKYEDVEKKDVVEKTDKICPRCQKPLVIKFGRFGRFLACSGFPECKHTEPLEDRNKKTGITCPKCVQGEVVERRTKKHRIFYGCSNWPDCDFALWDKPTGELCKKCGSFLVEKNGKIKCSNKNCK